MCCYRAKQQNVPGFDFDGSNNNSGVADKILWLLLKEPSADVRRFSFTRGGKTVSGREFSVAVEQKSEDCGLSGSGTGAGGFNQMKRVLGPGWQGFGCQAPEASRGLKKISVNKISTSGEE